MKEKDEEKVLAEVTVPKLTLLKELPVLKIGTDISLTNSAVSTLDDCPKKYFYEYERNLTAKVTPWYFTWGSLVHAGFEYVMTGRDIQELVEIEHKKLEEKFLRNEVPARALNVAEGYLQLLPTVFDAYLLNWGIEVGRYQVLAAEKEFELVISQTPHITLRGKIDRIVLDQQTGKKLIWELKTPAMTGDFYWARLPLDSQVKRYMYAAQHCWGIDASSCMYDVIQKVTGMKEPKENESAKDFAKRIGIRYLADKEKYFHRRVITHPQEVIDVVEKDLLVAASKIMFYRQHGHWPMHHPGNRIGACQYQDLCILGEDSCDVSEFYIRSDQHPELPNNGAEE